VKRNQPSPQIFGLAPLLLFMILVPVIGTRAKGTPEWNLPPKAETHIVSTQLFTPTLGGMPNTLSFTYSIPDRQLLPAAHQVTPLNVGTNDPLTWTVATRGSWFTAAPLAGRTPASFWVTPSIFGTGMTTFYTGVITVTVTDPVHTQGSPHRIDLNLHIASTSLYHVYLPLALRNYVPLYYPNDPSYGYQWAWETIEAPAAWSHSKGQGILIAVVDTGADLDHSDLAGKVRTDIDYDFVNDDDDADDDHGHGTHVSGIAAAATNNGIGVAGLGWEATLLPLKIISRDNNGDTADLVTAIRYAADNGADVINMSIGGTTNPCCECPASVQAAVDYAYAKGVVLVAASGSDGTSEEMFPANCEHVLGVASTKRDDSRSSGSNYGSHVSVAAPGWEIYSTVMNDSYDKKSGTSMATPHVAGLAALLIARYPSYTPDEVASAILDNAKDLGETGWDRYYGCGRINAREALAVGAHASSPVCLQGAVPWTSDTAKSTNTASFVPGEIIVAFNSKSEAETLSLQYGTGAEFLSGAQAWRLQVPPGQELAVLAQLRTDPAVVYADLNYLIFTQ
jgi:thermitase